MSNNTITKVLAWFRSAARRGRIMRNDTTITKEVLERYLQQAIKDEAEMNLMLWLTFRSPHAPDLAIDDSTRERLTRLGESASSLARLVEKILLDSTGD
ncbi:MAG: hypothetical protein HXL08_01800 [Candidatus Nanosynbacter sp.]|jgi:hypothetical protein|nr:hypothetical protein [Candidatus Nanosynbacter sp.]